MSRSGYSEDYEHLALYRSSVDRAIAGKRGQAFLRRLRVALDAIPDRKLIADQLIAENGSVCALGAVAKLEGMDVTNLDPENRNQIGLAFNIAPSMAAEIVFWNDEEYDHLCYRAGLRRQPDDDQDHRRWLGLSHWVDANLKDTVSTPVDQQGDA